jgi:hypothetical protein
VKYDESGFAQDATDQYSENRILSPDQRLLISPLADDDDQKKFWIVDKLPSLSTTRGDWAIATNSLEEVDRVAYDKDWLTITGTSLQRLNYSSLANRVEDWESSPFGCTPMEKGEILHLKESHAGVEDKCFRLRGSFPDAIELRLNSPEAASLWEVTLHQPDGEMVYRNTIKHQNVPNGKWVLPGQMSNGNLLNPGNYIVRVKNYIGTNTETHILLLAICQ